MTELLVVVGTIGLLLAMLLPSLRNSRQQAKALRCGSNLKQQMFGMMAYENDNETLPFSVDMTPIQPPPGGYAGNASLDIPGWWWFDFIGEYISRGDNDDTLFQCPSKRMEALELKKNILCGNYGVNQSICKMSMGRPGREDFIGRPLRSSNIAHPGETLLLVDSGYSMLNWWHATDIPPIVLGSTIIEGTAYIPGLGINRERDLLAGQRLDAIDGRHCRKKVNVAFADSHVTRNKADDLLVEKTGSDIYKNRQPLWVPK